MKHSFRLALLVCASFVGLAFAGPALAKYDPSLTIEQTSYKLGAPTSVDVFIAVSEDADPTAKLTIFSPVGYSANLGASSGLEDRLGDRDREGEGAGRRPAPAAR